MASNRQLSAHLRPSTFGVVVSAGLVLAATVVASGPVSAAPKRKPTATATATPTTTTTATPTATSTSTATTTLSTTLSTRSFPVTRNGTTLRLAYCANGSVLSSNSAVRTVVVVVHGVNRNACDYGRYAAEAASLSGVGGSTLVVAPRFLADSDPMPSSRTLYWSSGGWKSGSRSLTSPHPRPWAISSYEVLDALMTAAADKTRFPQLQRLVVAGHSAGGQFTNRYTASTRLPADLTPGVVRRSVIANPSSYLYFDARRYAGTTLRNLTSSEAGACPGYNRYKYGLQGRYAFLAALDDATLRNRYAGTQTRYLLGDQDTSTTSTSLDTSCEAKWQGASRFERGKRYHAYLAAALGADVHLRHQLSVVPGVGHNGRGMLTSTAGRAALFG